MDLSPAAIPAEGPGAEMGRITGDGRKMLGKDPMIRPGALLTPERASAAATRVLR